MEIWAYTVLARPEELGTWEGTGTENFLADQSGVVRHRAEDRAATATDPPAVH